LTPPTVFAAVKESEIALPALVAALFALLPDCWTFDTKASICADAVVLLASVLEVVVVVDAEEESAVDDVLLLFLVVFPLAALPALVLAALDDPDALAWLFWLLLALALLLTSRDKTWPKDWSEELLELPALLTAAALPAAALTLIIGAVFMVSTVLSDSTVKFDH